MRAVLRLSFFLFLLGGALAVAAPQFPALTGRVVDDAHILSPGTVQTLDKMLADYERGTTNQVVVVTLSSLQDLPIEDYGYQLGRAWQIGQKGKDNGVLLIVAPKDKKVRIEVGYGLEPLLTDAISSKIVTGVILPAFRSGNMEQGIVGGTEAILSVLGGKGLPAEASDQPSTPDMIILGLFAIFFFFFALRHPFIAAMLLSGNSSRFGGSRMNNSGWGGGGSGGGFSGGGGSFGGGGSSGSW
jgi:uncharacterized protein